MLVIPDFDTLFKGKTFEDTNTGEIYDCVGYGDNNGNPYFAGFIKDATGRFRLVTVLVKHAKFK